MRKLVLLVAILAMVLGGGSLAMAQTVQDTSPSEAPSQTTPSDATQSPAATNEQPTNAQPTTGQSALPCGASLFRQEQELLVQYEYPTPVSARARECEELGYVNFYPAPFMLDSEGFVYSYDPIEGIYSYLDPGTDLYYVLDPVTGEVSTFDPVSHTYL